MWHQVTSAIRVAINPDLIHQAIDVFCYMGLRNNAVELYN